MASNYSPEGPLALPPDRPPRVTYTKQVSGHPDILSKKLSRISKYVKDSMQLTKPDQMKQEKFPNFTPLPLPSCVFIHMYITHGNGKVVYPQYFILSLSISYPEVGIVSRYFEV